MTNKTLERYIQLLGLKKKFMSMFSDSNLHFGQVCTINQQYEARCYFKSNNPCIIRSRKNVIQIQENEFTVFLTWKNEFALCIFTAVKKYSFIRGQENYHHNQKNKERPQSLVNYFLSKAFHYIRILAFLNALWSTHSYSKLL